MKKIFKYIFIAAIITATVGITLIVVGMSFGANIKDVSFDMARQHGYSNGKATDASKEQSVPSENNIHSIDFELDGILIDISYGDKYEVTTNKDDLIVQENDNGEWKIKTIRSMMNYKMSDRIVSVTIPRDTVLKEISISLNGSSLKAESLVADIIDIDGSAAEISLIDIQCDSLELDLNAGNIEISGDVTKRVEADCNVGNITLNLSRPKSYRYEIETGFGQISIDGEKISGVNSKLNGGVGATEAESPFYSLDCDMGNIEINLD